MVASEPSGPRAAQIQAVRAVLVHHFDTSPDPWTTYATLAVQLVDAVHAAGRDQGEARGYQQAIANLRNSGKVDDWILTHVERFPVTRFDLADYLEAVGPGRDSEEAP